MRIGPGGIFGSIKWKLSFYLILIFITALVGIQTISLFGLPLTEFDGRYGQQRDRVFHELSLIADLKIAEIDHWIKERKRNTRISAENPFLSTSALRIKEQIQKLQIEHADDVNMLKLIRDEIDYNNLSSFLKKTALILGGYESIQVVDSVTGMVILSTDDENFNSDFSGNDCFVQGRRYPGTYIGNLFMSESKSVATLPITHPIRDNRGDVFALYVAHINIEELLKPMLHTGKALGNSGEALLVDHEMNILASLKYPLPDGSVPKQLNYRIKAKPAVFAARGEEGIIESEDYRGVSVLAGYRYLRITPAIGWGLVVKTDVSEVMAPLKGDIKNTFIIALLGATGVILLTLFSVGKIINPLSKLSETAKKVSDGDLDARAEIKSDDEIGKLSVVFNDMVDRISSWYEEMDLQVKSGIQELEKEILEREDAQDALKDQRMILHDILESTLAGYWDWNIPKNAGYMSPTLKNMFGYEEYELENSLEVWRKLVFREDLPGLLETFRKHVKSRGNIPFYNEVRYKHKDGSTVWVVNSGRVIEWDEDGNPIRMVGCHVDITRRMQAEEELEKAKRLATIGQIASGVAHEINNPLATIYACTEVLMGKLDKSKEILSNFPDYNVFNDYLALINDQVRHTREITHDLLDLAKSKAYIIKPIRLSDFISSTIKLFVVQEKNKQYSFNIDIRDEEQVFFGDWDRLRQVLVILIKNALEAMPDGGSIRIGSKPAVDDIGVCISVSDDGPGIEAEYINNIFEPFFTTKGDGGTGLGLAIADTIVSLHNGELNVISEPGKGTTFSIILPDQRKTAVGQ